MNKRTVVFDFDGVIHSYKSGWKGAAVIPDPPVPGIDRALKNIHDAGYETVIVSTRCATGNGKKALWEWLVKYGIDDYIDRVCTVKPPAIVYIDDRAIRFDGNPDSLLEQINGFHPWWEQGEHK